MRRCARSACLLMTSDIMQYCPSLMSGLCRNAINLTVVIPFLLAVYVRHGSEIPSFQGPSPASRHLQYSKQATEAGLGPWNEARSENGEGKQNDKNRRGLGY